MSPDPLTATPAAGQRQRLLAGARALGIALTDPRTDALLRLLRELREWSRAYNLTAVTAPQAMLTHHLLDSLAANAELSGSSVADVGTGAGFPGLPLAILHPEIRFTLIDSAAKKVRFVAHCVRALGLGNVAALHGRAEQLAAAGPFDTVMARACAPLPELLRIVAPLCGPATRVVALKGRYPAAEIAALPRGWRLVAARPVTVPGLGAERHLLRLVRRPPDDAVPAPGA
jgi:16S rRNA (guanine527-N7)-methyltransferase